MARQNANGTPLRAYRYVVVSSSACLDGLGLTTSRISSYKWTNELTTSS